MDVSIKTFLSAFMFFATAAQASEVVYGPALCPPEELTIFVQNTSRAPQVFWTQIRQGGQIDENHFELDPLSEMKIRGTQFLPTQQSYSLKALEQNALKFSAQCQSDLVIPLAGVTSPTIDHLIDSKSTHLRISIVNLFLQGQSGSMTFFDKSNREIARETFKLEKYYESQTLKLKIPIGAVRLHIEGKERLHSQVTLIREGNLVVSPGVVTKPVALTTSDENIYFLASTKDPRPEESFVVAISKSETEKLKTARDQIFHPELEKIIVAGIELGNGGFNRAMQSRDKAPYSWSVSRVDAFADFAHIDCDGSPDLTEERLEEKLSFGGRICFWRYRIIRELSLEEVSSGILKKP